jgi:hypothetical protein
MGTDNYDNADQSEVPEGCGVYQPGDVIDLGRSEVTDEQGRTVMTFEFEGVVATGSLGQQFAHAQTTAIRDVLAHLAAKHTASHTPAPEPEQPR